MCAWAILHFLMFVSLWKLRLFGVSLGMNFIRQNAKTILGLIITPLRLIVKNSETGELSLVSLSEKSCQNEGGNRLPPAPASLRISRREAYSLLPSLREQVLIGLGDLRPTVDLYANPKNHTEPLSCTPLNRCYAYNWHDLQFCCADPPWSHLEKMVTKAASPTERKLWLFVLIGAKPGKLLHGDLFWTA